jgi:uncharacterized membrane protein HdeD (DUF308 family)
MIAAALIVLGIVTIWAWVQTDPEPDDVIIVIAVAGMAAAWITFWSLANLALSSL